MRLVKGRDLQEQDLALIEAPLLAHSIIRHLLLDGFEPEQRSDPTNLGSQALDHHRTEEQRLRDIDEGRRFLVMPAHRTPLKPAARWKPIGGPGDSGHWAIDESLPLAVRFNLERAIARIEQENGCRRPRQDDSPTPPGIAAITGNAWDGIQKRYANMTTGGTAYPQHLTAVDEKGIGPGVRKLYGGNDTIQNQADIAAYNNRQSALGVTHGQIFDAMENVVGVLSLFEGGLLLGRLVGAGKTGGTFTSALPEGPSADAIIANNVDALANVHTSKSPSLGFSSPNGRDIAAKLDGHTLQSTKIAQAIHDGDIKVSVLGDELFERAFGEGPNTAALAIGNKIYLRQNSGSLLTDAVHEGTHALDYLNGFGLETPKTIWQWEKRAFHYERQFQISTGAQPEFSSTKDMMFHIW